MLSLRSQLMLLVIALVALTQAGLFAFFVLTAEGAEVRSVALSTALLAIFCVGVATLVAGLACARLLSRAWIRPVESFATQARRVGMGDYDHALSPDQPDDFIDLAQAMTTMQSDIAGREQDVAFNAQYDRLTGLPNRFQAEQVLDGLVKKLAGTEEPISIVLVDLNHVTERRAQVVHAGARRNRLHDAVATEGSLDI